MINHQFSSNVVSIHPEQVYRVYEIWPQWRWRYLFFPRRISYSIAGPSGFIVRGLDSKGLALVLCEIGKIANSRIEWAKRTQS